MSPRPSLALVPALLVLALAPVAEAAEMAPFAAAAAAPEDDEAACALVTRGLGCAVKAPPPLAAVGVFPIVPHSNSGSPLPVDVAHEYPCGSPVFVPVVSYAVGELSDGRPIVAGNASLGWNLHHFAPWACPPPR